MQWTLGRRDRQWQPLRSYPEQEAPDREPDDDSCAPRSASAAVQLSQMGVPDASRALRPHTQQQHNPASENSSGERQPLVGWDGGPHLARQSASQPAIPAGAPEAVPAPGVTLREQAASASEQRNQAQDASAKAERLAGATEPRERRTSFVRAGSAPPASLDAAADVMLAASAPDTAAGGSAHLTSEVSLPPQADGSAAQLQLFAAGLDRRPSQPLEAGLGHDRLAIRTSMPAAAGDGASRSRDDAAGASTSATAGDQSPVIRCGHCDQRMRIWNAAILRQERTAPTLCRVPCPRCQPCSTSVCHG